MCYDYKMLIVSTNASSHFSPDWKCSNGIGGKWMCSKERLSEWKLWLKPAYFVQTINQPMTTGAMAHCLVRLSAATMWTLQGKKPIIFWRTCAILRLKKNNKNCKVVFLEAKSARRRSACMIFYKRKRWYVVTHGEYIFASTQLALWIS